MVQLVVSGCIRCENFQCDFMPRTCALILLFQPLCIEFRAVMKQSKMHPNTTKRTNTCIKGPMGQIRCVHCDKLRCDFMAQTCALIAPVQHIFIEFHVVTKVCQVHSNTMKHTKTGVQGPIGWIGCVHCEKFQCDFMPRTFALIVPFQPILHRVSCSNQTI